MKITTLIENTTSLTALGTQHGLSFYIEANGKKILFDMGADDLFLSNAEKLGIDISAVDLAIISHGHYDHGGGLAHFLQHNDKAPVYISRHAFDRYYSKRDPLPFYIGLDQNLMEHPRLVFTEGTVDLGNGMTLFADVEKKEFLSPSNVRLLARRNGKTEQDDFRHEQNLLIREGDTAVLLGGCAHSGVVNILERAKQLLGRAPDVMLSGFHLQDTGLSMKDDAKFVSSIGKRLRQEPTHFYSCHCTGQRSFGLLKDEMGQQLQYIATGDIVTI